MNRTKSVAAVWLLSFLVLLAPAAMCSETADSASLQRALFIRLILDDDPNKSQIGVRHVEHQLYGREKEALSDIVAEHLLYLANLGPNLDTALLNSIAWHVKCLADTNIGRYRNVLFASRQRFSHPKLLERIDTALSAADPSPAESYAAGSLDINSLRAEADSVLATGRKESRAQFTKLQPGIGLETVLDQLGVPDDTTTTTVRVARYGRSQVLSIHYAGSGFIYLKLKNDGANGMQWTATEFIDELFEVKSVYKGKNFGAAQTLASLRGLPFREYLRFERKRITSDPDMLTVLEKRLFVVTRAADKYELIGMVAAVRLIAGYRSREALESLRRLSEGAPVNNVQVAARKGVKHFGQQLPNEEGGQSDDDGGAEEERLDSAR